MAIDWNADLGDLLRQWRSADPDPGLRHDSVSEGVGLAWLWPVLVVVMIVADLFWLFLPTDAEITRLQQQLERLPVLQQERERVRTVLEQRQQRTTEAGDRLQRLIGMMYAEREIDRFYRQVHEIARSNHVEVIKLNKMGVEPIVAAATPERGSEEDRLPPLFYRIRIHLRAQGDFLDYLRLREALLEFGKMIHIDEEKIVTLIEPSGTGKASTNRDEGRVVVEVQLSTYQSDRHRIDPASDSRGASK